MKTYTNKDGSTKYYASHTSAWNRAAKLNETVVDGMWVFEADLNGWFVFFIPENETVEQQWNK